MAKFIGRKQELQTLKNLLYKRSASLIVIKGRRRIGKSRLSDGLEDSQFFSHNIDFGQLLKQ
jgi:AAA+ ATPase superfamily predicted ATPase